MARPRFTFLSFLTLIPFVLVAWTLPARSQEAKAELSIAAKPGEWRYLNNDPLSTRYSPLDQINRDNFKDLKVAYRTPAVSICTPRFSSRRLCSLRVKDGAGLMLSVRMTRRPEQFCLS